MIYWRIQTDTGVTGYQVMDDGLNNASVVDDNGQPFTENIVYTVTDTSPEVPAWANA